MFLPTYINPLTLRAEHLKALRAPKLQCFLPLGHKFSRYHTWFFKFLLIFFPNLQFYLFFTKSMSRSS